MYATYLILYLFLIVLPLASSEKAPVDNSISTEQLVRYESDEGRFSIGFPKSWEVVKDVQGRDMMALAPSIDPEDLFLENVNIIFAKLESPIPVEDYYSFNLQSLRNLLVDYDLEESYDVKIRGRDAKKIIFTHRMGVVNAKVLQYLMLIDGYAYVLTFTADPLDFAKYRQKFEKIAQSFDVVSDKPI